MKSPTCVKKGQALNGRLAAPNKFLSRSTDKCKPFFQALKKNGADFRWNEECEVVFQGPKKYMMPLPLLSKSITGETFIYLAVAKSAVSGALIRDDEASKNWCIMSASL